MSPSRRHGGSASCGGADARWCRSAMSASATGSGAASRRAGSWGFEGGAASPCQTAVFNTAWAGLRTLKGVRQPSAPGRFRVQPPPMSDGHARIGIDPRRSSCKIHLPRAMSRQPSLISPGSRMGEASSPAASCVVDRPTAAGLLAPLASGTGGRLWSESWMERRLPFRFARPLIRGKPNYPVPTNPRRRTERYDRTPRTIP